MEGTLSKFQCSWEGAGKGVIKPYREEGIHKEDSWEVEGNEIQPQVLLLDRRDM